MPGGGTGRDTTRIRDELGFRETITREEAIQRTVEWERATPPPGFTPHQFDYDSEDEALRNASRGTPDPWSPTSGVPGSLSAGRGEVRR